MSKKKKQPRQQGEARLFNRLSGKLHGGISGILSSFRLSLTFRIAMHYCWQLLTTTLSTALIVTLFFTGACGIAMEHTVLRIAAEAPDADGSYPQAIIQSSGVSAHLTENNYPEDAQARIALWWQTAVSPSLWGTPPTLTLPASGLDGRTVLVSFELMSYIEFWCWLMLSVAICDIMRMMHFIRKRNRLDKRVLAPIRDITDMAATLSANNLSNRINIEGTKNELKDLAVVINTMLDRIERSYNSQKQFVSDASHELRTPIAVIQGYVSMLNRWGKDDKTVLDEGISAIAQETASMKELVESLLFLARHDKKTLMLEMERFDPCDVLTELHREAAMVTPQDQFIFAPAEHGMIEADRGMIKQVMRILCDNAVKYTPAGGTITMGVTCSPTGCTLTLSDNGPGISRDELPKIFDRFYRSDSARKSEGGGHGLGLSIARIIVVAHGGKIQVRSKVGEGTTFSVVLPAEAPPRHSA